jgi:S-methylmethionine-dependent homocysteine/selenocysteine methylase
MTDGGLETTLIFLENLELPEFAAVDLLRTRNGRAQLERYYRDYLNLAKRHQIGFILESPTWRASSDWAPKLGFDAQTMDQLNAVSIQMMHELKAEFAADGFEIVVSGCVGPRSDGYQPTMIMDATTASAYHRRQVEVFAKAGVDCVTAITMGYPDEAIGVVTAAAHAGVASVISFTVETDGSLVTGETLEDAIRQVDAATDAAPAYYMINCAHTSHFEAVISNGGDWVQRIKGIRANASRCSHAELDEAEELDAGNVEELAEDYRRLTTRLPHINIVGGCCGTDIRHLEKILAHRQPAATA